MDDVKTCTKCDLSKSVLDFHKSKTQKYGVSSICKSCAKIATKKWGDENRDKRLLNSRAYEKNNKESISARKKFKRESMTLDDRFKHLIKNAKSRKEYLVSIDALYLQKVYENQKGLCAYTKLPLLAVGNQLNTMSLDRIDSSKDYTEDNIQLVCVAINKMKLDMTEDRFIELCSLVTKNSKLAELPVT
jgi:hypothetical protein